MRTRILGREGSDQTTLVAEGSPRWEVDMDLERRVSMRKALRVMAVLAALGLTA
jgi:hypothetical protein